MAFWYWVLRDFSSGVLWPFVAALAVAGTIALLLAVVLVLVGLLVAAAI